MSLRRLSWNGYLYSLQIRRHWNTFFGLATVFEIKRLRAEKLLPEGAGYHIIGIYELCEQAKCYFDSFDNWWSFSCRLCDQYCEFYVMEHESEHNTFSNFQSHYLSARYAVQSLAKSSRGYVGPDKWKLT